MTVFKIGPDDALIVVDVQNDFCPGGALAVERADEVVPVLNRLMPLFGTRVFSRDWHPPNHISFSSHPKFVDKSWPPHCRQGTRGAEFHPDIKVPAEALIVSKGTDPAKEAYSAFEGTGLAEMLKERRIKRIFLGGLTTDYCVKNSVFDALKSGFVPVVLVDAVRAVDIPKGSGDAALEEMKKAGAVMIRSDEIG